MERLLQLVLMLVIVQLTAQAAFFGALIPSANYYVNQSTGSDSNNGTSTSTPFLTATKCMAVIATGQMCAVFGGSLTTGQLKYREQVTIPAVNIGVVGWGAYKPNFDCSDIISAATFSKTVGFTNIYQASAPTSNESAAFMSVWEDGTQLTLAASQAALDASPGYWISGNGTLSGTVHTVFIHATGDGDPASNGKVYEYNVRSYGVFSSYRAVVANLQTQRNYTNNGSLEVGARSLITSVLATQGTKHTMLVHTGTTLQSSIVSEIYYAGANSIVLVYNDDSPAQEGLTFRDVTVSTSTVVPGAEGIGGHTNTSGSFGALLYSGVTVTNSNAALSDQSADSTRLINSTISGGTDGPTFYAPSIVISDSTISATSHALSIAAASTVSITGSSFTGGVENQGVIRSSTGDIALSLASSTLTNTGTGSFGVELTNTGNSLTMSGNTFAYTPGAINAYKLPASYIVYSSDNNAFPAGASTAGSTANINNTWYSLAQVRSTFGQETHSTP